jgi:glycine/D-amino acid oxidase-like deaminating enzyme
VRPRYDLDARVFRDLERTMRAMFPALGIAQVTHRWGGPLAIPRDWYPAVTFDRATGVGAAGGYVGDGVTASNLAGRTLAELIAGVHTPRTSLAWVGHESPAWEREPLRWLGVNAGLALAKAADRREARTGRPARRLARALHAVTGH